MQRREFQATQGLLKDVMTKQAGSPEKAVLEAVMNSIDAGASWINVEVSSDHLAITDDGDGMLEKEIQEYFEKFGLKDDDQADKEFSEFRMGRGQIFSFGQNLWHTGDKYLVVDLQNDESTVVVNGNTETVDTSGLSYVPLEAEEERDGCRIEVKLYNEIENVDGKVSDIQSLVRYIPWFHDVELTINDTQVDEQFNVASETERAFIDFKRDDWGKGVQVYNKGAYVKEENITPFPVEVVTKNHLDVNFARNDILQTDEEWDSIKDDIKVAVMQTLIEVDKSGGNLKNKEQKWLLDFVSENEEYTEQVMDLKLFTTVTGQNISLEDLDGEDVTAGPKGNKQAEELHNDTSNNITVLDRNFEEPMKNLLDSEKIKEYTDAVNDGMKWEMKEIDYDELGKRRKQNFDRAEAVLDAVGFDGELRVGYSKYSDCWQNDERVVYVDKKYLKAPKQEFILRKIPKILEIAAQRGDTRQGTSHGLSFRRTWWEFTENLGVYQQRLLEGKMDL